MRHNKKIDYDAKPFEEEELMIRLLCSPLYYDADAKIVSAEAFNLRMLGKDKSNPEEYASLGHKGQLDAEGRFEGYLQIGYKIWDDKPIEENEYFGYGTFQYGDAIKINPQRIEIHSLTGNNKGHVGMFYVKSDNEYFKGPLPKDNDEIVEMLNDLSNMIADNISVAPSRSK